MLETSCEITLGRSSQESRVDFYQITPFENPQRWMEQNTFPILLLNDDNMIEEH